MLVVLEGINGCGKSTILEFLSNKAEYIMKEYGLNTMFITGNPGSTAFSSIVRDFFVNTPPKDNLTAQMAFVAGLRDFFLQHKELITYPRNLVLCSRFTMSTVVYGLAQGVDIYKSQTLIHLAGLDIPHDTIFCDVSVGTASERLKKRTHKINKDVNINSLVQLRHFYEQVVPWWPYPVKRLNCEVDKDRMAHSAFHLLEGIINERLLVS